MGKPLAGRRSFEAMGRSAASRGLPFGYVSVNARRDNLPSWARDAILIGWLKQKSTGVKA